MSITLRQKDEGDRYDSEQRKYILKRERNESQFEVEVIPKELGFTMVGFLMNRHYFLWTTQNQYQKI